MDATAQQNSEFDHLFDGTLYSLLSWKQLTAFWERLDPAAGWFIYAVGEERPEIPADSEHVATFVREIDVLLHKEHHEDYCGIVYADVSLKRIPGFDGLLAVLEEATEALGKGTRPGDARAEPQP